MASKPIPLAVHRNTIQGRRKRERAKEASRNVFSVMRQEDIRAYAFVGIGSDGKCFALWDTGGVVPMRVFPGVVKEVLSDDIAQSGLEDDFRASISSASDRDS